MSFQVYCEKCHQTYWQTEILPTFHICDAREWSGGVKVMANESVLSERCFTVTKEISFCYGHRVANHESKCRNVHGHQARVEVTVKGPLVAEGEMRSDEGMVIDFGAIKQALVDTVEKLFDHRFLMSISDRELYQLILPGLKMDSRGYNELGATYRVHGFGWIQELPGAPTAENLAFWCWQLLRHKLDRNGVKVISVRFWETPTSVAEYSVATA